MRIHHLAFRTADLGRLERFYVDVLGLRRTTRQGDSPDRVWLEAGEAVLMLERAEPGEAAVPPGTKELVAFAIDDRESWRARVERAGVAIEAETAHTLYFRDPDGRRIAVSTHPLRCGTWTPCPPANAIADS